MSALRHDWHLGEVEDLYQMPFIELLYQAQIIHRDNFTPNQVQLSTLLSIKTGRCPEDCAYCPQSGHFNVDIEVDSLLPVNTIIENAKLAKEKGCTRFCMGGAWRSPPKKAMPQLVETIKAVKDLGLETCVTLGMLNEDQISQLNEAGLDFYNHNLDSSPEYYEKIITTRSYQDRLDTLERLRHSEIKVCCGGIIGMGETRQDRIGLLCQLANLAEHPQSVPINHLVPVAGTPLEKTPELDPIEFVRTIAIARIMMPKSFVRLSAGRESMSDCMQALCFFAGANSIFYGDKLLTTPNPSADKDQLLLKKLGIDLMQIEA